jgi:hypothetical protein
VEPVVSQPRASASGPLTVLGPISIPGVAGGDAFDERSLALGSAPAFIVRRTGERGLVRHAVVFGGTLGRRGLMDLLYALAPYKAHGPDRFARVLDNWGLHDRAKAGGASENLLLQHVRSLGSSWKAFAAHREFFMAILRDESENTLAVPVIAWEKRPDGGRRWRLDTIDPALAQVIKESVPRPPELDSSMRLQLDGLVGLIMIPYLLPELAKGWPAWKPLVKGGKSNYIGPASVPMMALLHRRAILNSSFIRAIEALDFD